MPVKCTDLDTQGLVIRLYGVVTTTDIEQLGVTVREFCRKHCTASPLIVIDDLNVALVEQLSISKIAQTLQNTIGQVALNLVLLLENPKLCYIMNLIIKVHNTMNRSKWMFFSITETERANLTKMVNDMPVSVA